MKNGRRLLETGKLNSRWAINSGQNIDHITVYNIIGEIILEEKPNKKQIAVDVSKWPNNIYTIRINRKDIQITEKLIIQH